MIIDHTDSCMNVLFMLWKAIDHVWKLLIIAMNRHWSCMITYIFMSSWTLSWPLISDGRNMSGSAGRIQCQRWSGEVGGSPVLGWGATIMIGTGENPQSWWAPEQTWKKRKWYLIWIGYCAESVIQFLSEQTKKTMSIVSWIKQRRGSKDTKYLQFFSLIPIKTLPPGSCLPPQESLPPSAARFPKIYIWREE